MADGDTAMELSQIKVQPPLFRITEVFLWDGALGSRNGYLSSEPLVTSSLENSCVTTDEESCTANTINEHIFVDEFELVEMDALGLPLSFATSKVWSSATSRFKRNGTKKKATTIEMERNTAIAQVNVLSEIEIPASSSSCVYAMDDQTETPYHAAKEHFDDSTSTLALGSRIETDMKPARHDLNSISLVNFSEELVEDACSQAPSSEASSSFVCDGLLCYKHGDWRVLWDPFYQRNYFFDVNAHESTWHPPPGLEKYAFSCSNIIEKENVGVAEKNVGSEQNSAIDSFPENGRAFHANEHSVEMPAKMETGINFSSYCTDIGYGNSLEENAFNDPDEQKEKQHCGIIGSHSGYDLSLPTISENETAFSLSKACTSFLGDDDTVYEYTVRKGKRRVRKRQWQMQELTSCLSDSLMKYWCQRYSLFSLFDNGIKMDEESWFSVTPEMIAKHHSFRCGGGTIIDCFTGVGGNAIQFAMRSNHVIAIDVDPLKIDSAQHNAAIYGVCDKIDFIKSDFFKIAPSLKGDVVFMSPPWGGPDYVKMQTYDLRCFKPHDGYHLFKIASMISAKVVMFLPKNINLDQLAEISLASNPPWSLEVEKNYLNGKLKSITAYFKNPAVLMLSKCQ